MIARGVTGSVLVLLGGFVVATMPHTSAPVSLDLIALLRGREMGRMAGLVVVLVGLGLLAGAWLSLCRHVARPQTSGQSSGDDLALVRTATLCWSLPLLLAPPLFSRDGWSYAAQGVLARIGLSPYEYGPGILDGPFVEAVDARWWWTPAPYGPIPLLLGRGAATVTTDPWLLVIAHRGLALIGLLLLAWAVPRLARWCGTNPALASAVVLAGPLMIAHGVGGLHNDVLMVGLAAAALVVTVEKGWVYGALLAGLAAGVKAPGALVCVGIALLACPPAARLGQRLQALVRVGLVAGAALVLPGLLGGLGVGWLHALGVPGSVRVPLSMSTMLGIGLDSLAAPLGTPQDFFLGGVRLLAQLASLVVIIVVALRWRTGEAAQAVSAVAMCLGVLVLTSPVVHLWYFIWPLPFLAAMRIPRWGRIGVVFAVLVAGVVAPLDSSLHRAYLAIVVGSLVATALTTALLLTRRGRRTLEWIATSPWLPTGDVDWSATSENQVAGAIRPATSPSEIRPPSVPGAV